MKRTLVFLLTRAAVVGAVVVGAVASTLAAQSRDAVVDDLRVEARTNPTGIDARAPRFSWKINDEFRRFGARQTAYRVRVASSRETLEKGIGDLWDSGKVASDVSLFISYEGKPLQSLTRYWWNATVWNEKDEPLTSATATWLQGVVDESDWCAEWIAQPESARPDVDLSGANWIACATERETASGYAVEYFRREFEIDRPQSDFDEQNLAAILYYAAHQKFEIFVNGARAGHSIGMVFNADQLRSIDVSEYLRPGKNVVAVVVSNDSKNSNNTKANNGELRPTALVAKLVVRELDKANAPTNLPTPNRFGTPGEVVCAVGTDTSWKAGLTAPDDWRAPEFDDSAWENAKYASFVAKDGAEGLDAAPWGKLRRRTETVSPAFQKSFDVASNKRVASATLAVCAPGLFEPYLDGQKLGDQVLTPSLTRYDKRLLYNVFDLTDQFADSSKTRRELQFLLGHSWYDVRSIVTWNFDAAPWRDFPRLRAQLVLTYDDGSKQTVATDDSWTYSTSPVLFDCVRQGEIVDGAWKREILGNAQVVAAPLGAPKLVAQKNPVSVATDEYPAKSVSEVKPGVYVVDMGRNCAGWARIALRGQRKGDVVRFKYSERVVESGEIERHDIEMHFMEGTPAYMTGMKGGFQTDFYFCNGDAVEYFEPRFTYNGYQYVEVVGLREAPKPEDFVGRRINTNFNEIGSFSCNVELLNRLQAAMLESYRNNFVAGYPTDCPHREKNGWTGDAQLACELAQFNFENTAAYEKWIDDLVDEQREDGNLPGIVPTGDWGYPWGNGPAWDSALVLIPWYLYVYRGDRKILEDAFDAMKKYVDYMTSREHEDGLVYHGLGDWVFPKTQTPTEITSTGYYYLDAKIVAQAAQALGKTADAEQYARLADRIRKDYNAKLYKGNGVYANGSQTSQCCPIHQGFAQALPKEDQDAVFGKLVEAVEKENGHFDCGILGVKYILRSLAEGGRNDLALQMMLQDTKPAMKDWIDRGAGTLWEDWNEGSSRNHIMFGDFSAWFYQSLAGIKLAQAPDVVVASVAPESVAFKRFVFEPKSRVCETTAPGRDPVSEVSATVDSPYGKIASSWKRATDDGKTVVKYAFGAPFNTTATVVVPCDENDVLTIVKGADVLTPKSSDRAGVKVFEMTAGDCEIVVEER